MSICIAPAGQVLAEPRQELVNRQMGMLMKPVFQTLRAKLLAIAVLTLRDAVTE